MDLEHPGPAPPLPSPPLAAGDPSQTKFIYAQISNFDYACQEDITLDIFIFIYSGFNKISDFTSDFVSC